MQTLFDFPMSSSLSYLVAIIVILGLLAIFAIIVRRVASQGMNPEGGRGRGPRLGVVDTFALDRTRQLVIVRRDNVEHLLLVGGSNDILVESNIVRAMGASVIREPQANFALQQAQNTAPQYEQQSSSSFLGDEPQPMANYAVKAPAAPAPQAPQIQAPQIQAPPMQAPLIQAPPQAPRLKPAQAPVMPAAQPLRTVSEPQDQASSQDPFATSAQQYREALNNAELQALAKRLEASIPPMVAQKTERPAPQPAPVQPAPPAAQAQFAPQDEPKAPPAPQPSAPQFAAPAPQQHTSAMPQAPQPQLQAAPIQPQPDAASAASYSAAPVMPLQRAPLTPPPAPFPQQQAPQPAPVPPPPLRVPPQPAPMAEPVRDKQASALDENLRRLLGRKLDPK